MARQQMHRADATVLAFLTYKRREHLHNIGQQRWPILFG
jgi:hypothetical protein